MNGKDFCNCEHAKMLHGHLVAAESALIDGEPLVKAAIDVIQQALRKHADMRRDYERDIDRPRSGIPIHGDMPHEVERAQRLAGGELKK